MPSATMAAFINIARGQVIDEDALVAALCEGRLGGAGTRCVPRRADPRRALGEHPNVVCRLMLPGVTTEAMRGLRDTRFGPQYGARGAWSSVRCFYDENSAKAHRSGEIR